VIRAATPADLESLAGVEAAVFDPAVYPTFFFRQAMELWPGLLLVAELEGTLVGYVLCAPSTVPGEAWILSAAVRPERRGVGLGRGLMEAALVALASFSAVRLTVDPGNTAAIGLYRRLGFGSDGVAEDYFGARQPRLLMSLRRLAER